MTDPKKSKVLIVGASAAGMATATSLRRRGHEGQIVVLGSETHVPYDRPPLSKQYQTQDWVAERIHLVPNERISELNLELVLGVGAESLDLAAREVHDSAGTRHTYDQLVIATGLVPRRLSHLAAVSPLELRTLDDARRLKAAVRPGSRIAIVGAGFIGLESASTSCQLGAEVTVVEPIGAPLADRIGRDAAARLVALHEQHGVRVLTGASVESAQMRGEEAVLALADGREVVADEVLVSVGSIPCTEWLRGNGFDLSNGVLCDEFSRVVPGVWAAGDIARWYHAGYAMHLRVEHRTNATEQGQHVAAGIMGELLPYTPLPFFWTDHYDVRIQLAGRITPGAVESHVEIEGREDAFLRLFHEEGRLQAVLAWNTPRALLPYRRQLASALAVERVSS